MSRWWGDNCEAQFICFYSSVVFACAVCNQHVSEYSGQMDGWGKDGGMDRVREGCSCCLVSFCFLTDTTKSIWRGKTVVFVCRHWVMLLVPTERGWMKELLRQQTHHPSVCQIERERDGERIDKCKELESQRERERKVKDGDQMKRREWIKEWKMKTKRQWKRKIVRDSSGIKNREMKRLKGAENWDKEPEREQFSPVSLFLCIANVCYIFCKEKRGKKTIKVLLQLHLKSVLIHGLFMLYKNTQIYWRYWDFTILI